MVIRARVLGYCMGVRRAVDIALNALTTHPDHSIYTLGPLIHNNEAIEMLRKKGIHVLDKNFEHALQKSKKPPLVVLSAHGTAISVKKTLENFGAIIIDATCPRVLINQKRMSDYAKDGYTIFIVGDASHGEVIALKGSISQGSECYVLQNAQETNALIARTHLKNKKAIVISQTTITQHEYDAVSSILKIAIDNIIIFETICPATQERQSALRELFSKVEAIIIVGGKNSANTTRLYQTALELSAQNIEKKDQKLVCHIETARDIPDEFFSCASIGLTAGASTPDEVIKEVENCLLGKASEVLR